MIMFGFWYIFLFLLFNACLDVYPPWCCIPTFDVVILFLLCCNSLYWDFFSIMLWFLVYYVAIPLRPVHYVAIPLIIMLRFLLIMLRFSFHWFPFYYAVIAFSLCCDSLFIVAIPFLLLRFPFYYVYYVAIPFSLCCDSFYYYAVFPLDHVAILFLLIPFSLCCNPLFIMLRLPLLSFYSFFIMLWFPLCHVALLFLLSCNCLFIMLRFHLHYVLIHFL